jgi:hypothetical protein
LFLLVERRSDEKRVRQINKFHPQMIGILISYGFLVQNDRTQKMWVFQQTIKKDFCAYEVAESWPWNDLKNRWNSVDFWIFIYLFYFESPRFQERKFSRHNVTKVLCSDLTSFGECKNPYMFIIEQQFEANASWILIELFQIHTMA